MNTLTPDATKFKEFAAESKFRLQPPLNNPFAASSAIAVTKVHDGVDLVVAEPPHGEPQPDHVLEDILSRTRRDVERYPKSARAHSNLGLALLNQGDVPSAIHEFEMALQCDPKSYVGAANLARVKLQSGDLEGAEKLYRELLEHFPNDPSSLLNLAFVHVRRAEFNHAAELLRLIVRHNENVPVYRYHLGMVLLKLGQKHEAISQLKTAARGDVRSPELHQALGVAYSMSGDLKRAAKAFRTALTLSPRLPDAVHGLALVLLQEGAAQECAEMLLQHLENEPNDQAGRELLARCYFQLERFDRARAQLNRVIAKTDMQQTPVEQARLANNVAICFGSEGNVNEARKWLATATRLRPDSPVPYVNLARLLINENSTPEAIALLAKCKEEFPDDEQTRMLLANVYERLGEYDKAAAQLAPLIERDNASSIVTAYLGALLAERLGDYPRALKIFAEGLRKDPLSPIVINNFAYAHLMNGNVHDARNLLGSLPKSTPVYPELLATMGLLRLWQGELRQGEQFYHKAAHLASSVGNAALARSVRQKMHLELARALLRNRDLDSAAKHVRAGLLIKNARDDYHRDLQALLNEICG